MRLIALALVATLALTGCGGDDPEPQQEQTFTPRPATQRPAADTVRRDTAVRDTSGLAAGPDTDRTGPERPRADGGVTAPAGQRLYTIQVAAFTDAGSATEWSGRLQRQGLPTWTSVFEQEGRTFYRVRVGAVPTVAEARRLGSMLSQRYEWPVWVAPLTPADRIPDDAVANTRRVLEGG